MIAKNAACVAPPLIDREHFNLPFGEADIMNGVARQRLALTGVNSAMRLIAACLIAGNALVSGCAPEVREQNVTRMIESLGGTVNSDDGGQIIAIDLSGSAVTDSQLQFLRDLPRLRELKLGVTGITDEGLKSVGAVRSLEVLSLWGTPVSNAGLTSLYELKGLKRVTCDFTQVTTSGLRRLQAELPDCRVEWDRWD